MIILYQLCHLVCNVIYLIAGVHNLFMLNLPFSDMTINITDNSMNQKQKKNFSHLVLEFGKLLVVKLQILEGKGV